MNLVCQMFAESALSCLSGASEKKWTNKRNPSADESRERADRERNRQTQKRIASDSGFLTKPFMMGKGERKVVGDLLTRVEMIIERTDSPSDGVGGDDDEQSEEFEPCR